MKYRRMGNTDWNVSTISMGCWGIGGQWGPVSEEQALRTIRTALDEGVNLFDTADAYGMGTSEVLVGKALRNKPDDVYIATKVGNWGRRFDDPLGLKSIWSILNCCHASLNRLGVETIDLYQCHVGDPDHPEIFLEAFERLKSEGKIRQYGISTNHVHALEAMNSTGECASCQINYSLLARDAEKDILPYCLRHNIGVLLRGPLAKGILSGKFTGDTVFTDSVRERWNDGAGREGFLRQVETVDRLRPLVTTGRTLIDLALQFALAHPAVTCAIPGMKNSEQARQNASAADGELTVEDLRFVDSVSPPLTGTVSA